MSRLERMIVLGYGELRAADRSWGMALSIMAPWRNANLTSFSRIVLCTCAFEPRQGACLGNGRFDSHEDAWAAALFLIR